MGTLNQKELAKVIVENAGSKSKKHMKELLVLAGYDETTAIASPGRTIAQKGVQEELAVLGFHEDNAKRVVAAILETGEDNNRLKAADLIFKVQGSYAPEKSLSVTLSASNLTPEQIAKINQIALDE